MGIKEDWSEYDSYKLDTPEDEKSNECGMCGKETDNEYCSPKCYQASLND